jgi:hypothetical protein
VADGNDDSDDEDCDDEDCDEPELAVGDPPQLVIRKTAIKKAST